MGANLQNQGSGTAEEVEGTTPGGGELELRRVACHITESLFKRLLRKLFPDQRKNERHLQPPLVGYLGMMHTSRSYDLGDISVSGFCLLTDERWTPGTEMPITLQRKNLPDGKDPETFTVQATVVRCGENGVGFSIVLCEEASQAIYGNPLRVRWITRQEMEGFLNNLKDKTSLEEPPEETAMKPNPGLKAAFEGGR
jgi:PilZ domain-containing protein